LAFAQQGCLADPGLALYEKDAWPFTEFTKKSADLRSLWVSANGHGLSPPMASVS
jgi:hypothetical protein